MGHKSAISESKSNSYFKNKTICVLKLVAKCPTLPKKCDFSPLIFVFW